MAPLNTLFLLIIRAYKKIVSPYLPPACRFHPTCSDYAVQSIEKYGALRGSLRAMQRLCRCHPFHPGGADPVE